MDYKKDTTTGNEFAGMNVDGVEIYGLNVNAKGLSKTIMDQTIAIHPQNPSILVEESKTSFWTSCPMCHMKHQYPIQYLNSNLLCHNCRNPFVAFEILSPLQRSDRSRSLVYLDQAGLGSLQSLRLENTNISAVMASSTIIFTQAFESMFNHLKGGCGESSLTTCGDRISTDVPSNNVAPASSSSRPPTSNFNHGKKRASTDRLVPESLTKKNHKAAVRIRSSQIKVHDGTRNLSRSQNRSILMYKARRDIGQKLKEWNVSKFKEANIAHGSNNSPVVSPNVESQAAEFVPVLMAVPDSDFNDFDKNRVEEVFNHNQLWAIYDDEDGMPRFYAIINKVISLRPFKIEISWLIPKGNLEFGPRDWVGQGFPKTSGIFQKGKHEVYDSLSAFSHMMTWRKGIRGAIQIYPQKGDVWALYRNWSPDWNIFTSDDVKHSYDMVEVLEDYKEEKGLTVAPLVKAYGFKTVFKKHPDARKTWTIPKEEMFRFSHQVPSFVLTGEEGSNAPKGCWELDPAALPMELLAVLTHAQEEEVQNTGHQFKDQSSTCCRNDNTDIRQSQKEMGLLVYQRRGKKMKSR